MKRAIIIGLALGLITSLSLGVIAQSATWQFNHEGMYPRHLPDAFMGQIDVKTLTPPTEIQGVYKFDNREWLFWSPGVPGATLKYLEGGLKADYFVTTIGACAWEIPTLLQEVTLRTELENDIDWWGLEDRRELAVKITQWYSVEEFGEPKFIQIGTLTKPDWNPFYISDDWRLVEARCVSETGLRYALLGGQFQPNADEWYYTKESGDYEWRRAVQDKPFNLPIYVGLTSWQGGNHWVCALQVGIGQSDLDNWLLFQFNNPDIQVGDLTQMGSPGKLRIYEITGLSKWAVPTLGELIGSWEY